MRIWHLTEYIDGQYVAEDGVITEYVHGEHCKACAYTRVVCKYGGNVDLRGFRNTPCFQFLSVIVRQERDKHSRRNIQ